MQAVDFDDAPADDVLDEDAEQALPVQVEKTEEASEAPAALAADQQGEEPAVKLEATAVKDEDGNVASAMVRGLSSSWLSNQCYIQSVL